MTKQESLMAHAIQLAKENVDTGHGGPFGAIVVKDGEIIGRGSNEVTASNDPTAHAEVQAIREACQHLESFQLTGCEIYTSCEPCPMCIGAIYWARPDAVYYACTKEEAAAIGFDDQFIYEELGQPIEERSLKMKKLVIDKSKEPFENWTTSSKKIIY
ncbi:nucleoside deaminase [Domibacillus aminovorans]|uniref:Guanine deaminase n=1 Tax=Domibacillus aminovorans TaxID=29332 RepID=A0A177L6U6_9BACI|nr:nucleoside deaminase [Domibacillus aminovorans]OAH61174.1 guanine deaminase [Domibacillus aminovorans]